VADFVQNLPIIPLLVMIAIAALLTGLVERAEGVRVGGGPVLFAALISLGLIFVTTLARSLPSGVDLRGVVTWASGGSVRFVTDFTSSEEIWLNILLFVPAGLTWYLYTRAPVRVLGAAALLSFVIECSQGILGLGLPDVSDIIANTIGAFLGLLFGSAAMFLRSKLTDRMAGRTCVAMLVAAVLLVCAVPLGATIYQNAYRAELQHRLQHVSLHDVVAWQSDIRLARNVGAAGYVYSDGFKISPAFAQVRFPSSFIFVRQCLIAEWRRTGLDVAATSGQGCQEAWI
jgi:hypothetical protein